MLHLSLASLPAELPPRRGVLHSGPEHLHGSGFTAPWDAFELARHAQREGAELVVCSMAWLVGEGDEAALVDVPESERGWAESARTMNYWAMRVGPLLETGVAFVACNRVGTERHAPTSASSEVHSKSPGEGEGEGDATKESTFTGSSCVMSLAEGGIEILAFGGKRGEQVVWASVPLPRRP